MVVWHSNFFLLLRATVYYFILDYILYTYKSQYKEMLSCLQLVTSAYVKIIFSPAHFYDIIVLY